MKIKLIVASVAMMFSIQFDAAAQQKQLAADVCVYGATSGGVAAAVTAAKLGKSAILIEPGRHLGGMSSGGLGATDIGNKAAIGGLSRQFYKRIGTFYGADEAWKFEPHRAEQIYREWVSENKVVVVHEHRLAKVEKDGRRIVSIVLENAAPEASGAPAASAVPGVTIMITASMFIDASYEGDLMAKSGVSYAVGRESVAQYGESLNGIRGKTPKHQFLVPTDPFVRPGDPSSGLLPLIQAGDGGKPGDGDRRVQAYNFRMCLTQDPKNRMPIAPPPGYDEKRYELLARYLEALVKANRKPTLASVSNNFIVANGKTDMNNNGAVSTDFIGANYEYPDGDWPTRNRIWKEHEDYQRGLFHFLATSARVPKHLRDEMNSWGLCRDEFQDTGGWPHQLYIREARRMVGRYVITQLDCEHKRTVEDPVGMGAYNMDSHNCQRIVKNGLAENEGDVQVPPAAPYSISYRALTPKAEECENLLVPVCFSASHIAYGSARMEPVFMVLGQSAAAAGVQALDEKKSVQGIDAARLQKTLLGMGQVLTLPAPKK